MTEMQWLLAGTQMSHSTSSGVLTIEGGGTPLNAQPALLRDGLVDDAQNRHAVPQERYECAEHGLACMSKSSRTYKKRHQISQSV